MNIFPKWMADKILEHIDRLPTYAEVREKVIIVFHARKPMVCDYVGRTLRIGQQTLSLGWDQYGEAKPLILIQGNQ